MTDTYRIKEYEIWTQKIPAGNHFTMAVIADLHSKEYGPGNEDLISCLKDLSPDMILLAGDLMVRTRPEALKNAAFLLRKMVSIAPVFYAYGNHESRMKASLRYQDSFLHYEEYVKRQGVQILSNSHREICLKGIPFAVYGLDLPLRYYMRCRSYALTQPALHKALGRPANDVYSILLAHNPAYGNEYFDWKADLILCGHYHGGVLRFDENHGLISPRFWPPFPPYCCGRFSRPGQNMLVSAGMGEHTVPVRIHNPREMLVVRLHGGGSLIGT